MTRAPAGSAHHQPSPVLSATARSAAAEVRAHSAVSAESATRDYYRAASGGGTGFAPRRRKAGDGGAVPRAALAPRARGPAAGTPARTVMAPAGLRETTYQ